MRDLIFTEPSAKNVPVDPSDMPSVEREPYLEGIRSRKMMPLIEKLVREVLDEHTKCEECGMSEAKCECVMKEQADYYGYTSDRPDDMKYFGPTLKKFKVDPDIVSEFSQVWNEQEVRDPTTLKNELEQGYGYNALPLEFYAAMASAIKRYNRAYDKYVGSAYTPGWRD